MNGRMWSYGARVWNHFLSRGFGTAHFEACKRLGSCYAGLGEHHHAITYFEETDLRRREISLQLDRAQRLGQRESDASTSIRSVWPAAPSSRSSEGHGAARSDRRRRRRRVVAELRVGAMPSVSIWSAISRRPSRATRAGPRPDPGQTREPGGLDGRDPRDSAVSAARVMTVRSSRRASSLSPFLQERRRRA